MSKKKYWWLLELNVLIIIIILISIFYLNKKWIGLIFNSDILFIPDVFNDLNHGGHFKDWIIATTGMFFPDWLIFYFAHIFSKKIYFQFLIVACINTFLLYLSIRLIYSQFFKQKEAFIFSLASILIFLFLSIKVIEPYIFLMVLGQHTQGFIVGLFYIWLQLLKFEIYEYKKLKILLISMIGISLLMGGSDVLFILQFLVPILLVYILMYLNKECLLKNVFWYSLVPLGFSIAGFLLINKIVINSKIWNLMSSLPIGAVSYNKIKDNVHFLLITWQAFTLYQIITCIYLLFYSLIIFNCIYVFFKKKYIFKNNKKIFLFFIIIFSVLLNIGSFIIFEKDGAIRHLETFFYFPILFFFIMGSFYNKQKNIFKIASLLIIFFSIIYLITDYKKIFNIDSKYYPYEVFCIDQALKNHDNYGVANYWTARPFTMFSQKNLHITEVFNNLSPFAYATNLARITSKNSYSFVILNVTPTIPTPNAIELNESDIININGAPEKKVVCGSKKLLIYKKGSFKIPVFTTKGDSFFWPAYLLPSQINNKLRKSTQRCVTPNDGAGFVSFGPYVTLFPGKYQVYIEYKSNLSSSKKIGVWDISSNLSNIINSSFNLFGTNNKYLTLNKIFIVPKKSINNIYEFRIYTNGKSTIFFKGIRLCKLKE